ncbi:MAG: helix-turn-helix domain-containing protein [Candidatus Cloacimonetes bacterium]|nr:helix-turn-helix domain-containing protein [Candidatus Cloacimonadota bacterium]
MSNKKISPIGESWEDYRKRTFTPEEIMESDLRVALISELIRARNDQGITQKQLEEASGVKQPVIARMEKGTTDPQLMTILKILRPLGKTLAIVPIEEKQPRNVHFKTFKKGSIFKQKPMR